LQDRHLDEQHFIEEVGVEFERAGLTRMAGRILGCLLVCDPPHQSTSDLAETLQASKGSISTMTRLLIQAGLVERLSLPGERRDYFCIKLGAWSQLLQHKLQQIASIRQLAERGLDLLQDEDPERRHRLEEMRDIHAFFEQEWPQLLERWERYRNSSQPEAQGDRPSSHSRDNSPLKRA
jgi:DNA-binding transcriptional regulator GbsR (MarR family)